MWVALTPPPGFRAFFSVSFFHFVLESFGRFPRFSRREAGPEGCRREGKADLKWVGFLRAYDWQKQCLQTQAENLRAFAQNNLSK
ncbi:MAG: hypothetical protein J0H08_12460 [Rhizobiales bacterium]|nr:hypothetical protein [Hyphomicrobiales bacterium]